MYLPATVIPRVVMRVATFVIFTLAAVLPAGAQENDWEQLNQKILHLNKQGDYASAIILAKQAIVLAESIRDPDSNLLGTSLINLAELYRTQKQYELAEPIYLRALTFWENYLGRDHPFLATVLNPLAGLYQTQQKYAKAEPLLRRTLAIQAKALGPAHAGLVPTLLGLANTLGSQRKYEQAIRVIQNALTLQEQTLGPEHPAIVATLQIFAVIYSNQGQFALAEPIYKRILAIQESSFGLEHLNVAVSLYKLADLYADQNKLSVAEPLFKRSLSISEKVLGADNPIAIANLYGLVKLYTALGQFKKAEPLYDRVLVNLAKSNGPFDPAMVAFMFNLAPQDMSASQLVQAERVFGRYLVSEENNHGPDAPALLGNLIKLADVYRMQSKFSQAEPLFKRALLIEEKLLPPEHPGIALILNKLAELYRAQGQHAAALTMARRATALYKKRNVARGTSEGVIHDALLNQTGLFNHLDLLALNPGKEAREIITNEAFEVVQLAQASGTASAIAKMAARFASGDDALAQLIKRQQDATDRMSKAEAQLLTAASQMPHQRHAADEKKLRVDIAQSAQTIAAIDAELTWRFPNYQELTRLQPVSVPHIQALLKLGEAMLVYKLNAANSFLWVVTRDRADFLPLDLKIKDIAVQVAMVRAEMESDDNGRPRRISVDVLHDLYQQLVAPAELKLAGIEHLMVVPSGPLQSLPFGMLVTAPSPAIHTAADYAKVDWLAKRYAFSVLPAVSSLQALRQLTPVGPAQEPFAGFGDPSIGRGLGPSGGRGKGIDARGIFRNVAFKNNEKASALPRVEIADVEFIREQDGLPETADELRAMAATLKGDQKFIWLRDQATETRVKNLDLFKFRTIAFATHGVMAGEISGVGEAGLILTPPRQANANDDGYLSAGEIARLKLNADWVLLSACNTAAADGTPDAEGFSGLAKAFFYAGARSLLVSHWSIESDSAMLLTTGILKEYEANPGQGKANAHRKAMLTLMSTPQYAHPLFWAPFAVVGEGGPAS